MVLTSTLAWSALECTAIQGATTSSEPLYQDGFSAGWIEAGSYNIASRNTAATPVGRVGTSALEVLYATYWGAFEMHRMEPINTSGKRALVFRVRGIVSTAELDQLYIGLDRSDGVILGYLPVTNYMITPDKPPFPSNQYDTNKWYTVTIPLTAFNAQNTKIKGVIFMVGGLATPIYLDEVWLVQGLEFPLGGMSPYTATINGVLDHHMAVDGNGLSIGNCADAYITAYTGEEGRLQFGAPNPVVASAPTNACAPGVPLNGYQKNGGAAFSVGGQYDMTGGNDSGIFLYYDGHTGYDYPVSNGTPVYAVANGVVQESSAHSYGDTVVVKHQNGYTSHYLHLTTRNVFVGQEVRAGVTSIGTTGAGHLHFTMQLYGERVDPYGWIGSYPDPARAFAVNTRLWK